MTWIDLPYNAVAATGKIFLELASASFSKWDLGFDFADPRRI
jgi:hypothetical protein